MVKKRVIPCLDVAGGRVVKGVRFEELRDVGDPVELATRYSELGADELVFLDITATLEDRGPLLAAGRACRRRARDPLHRRRRDHGARGRAGAAPRGRGQGLAEPCRRRRPELLTALAAEFGAQAVVCAIDARGGRGRHPRRRNARGLDAVAWAQEAVDRGAGEILLTSIDADGTRNGYDLELTRQRRRRGARAR